MIIRSVVLSAMLLLTVPLFGRTKDDMIVMTNGDRLTCQIKGLDADTLYISLDYVLGTISVQWSKVAHLQSSHLYIVKTEDGSVYTGTLSTSDTPGTRPIKIQVVENEENTVTLDAPKVIDLAETSERFWQRFNGAINSGITYSKGNQSTQYNISSLAAYPRERWAAQVSLNSTLSSSTGTEASTRNQLSFGALHLLPWNNYFYSGLVNFLQSSEQGIDRQVNLGGGIGRHLKSSNRTRISLLGGLAWQSTQYNQSVVPQATQKLVAALISGDIQISQFNKTSLNVNATVLPALTQPGRVFFNTNASYYVKLFSNLSWNVSFYGSWDNQPPPTFSGSDYGTSSGLSWTFGNR